MSKNIKIATTPLTKVTPVVKTKPDIQKVNVTKQISKPTKPTKVNPPLKTQKVIKPAALKQEIKKEQPKEGFKQIKLANLADQLSSQKCNYLVDKEEYSAIFFKYKGRVINIPEMLIEIAVGHKSKEEVIQQIRKAFLWGIKTGDMIYINLSSTQSLKQLMEGVNFWQPSKLFVPYSKMDQEWYKSTIVSKIDPQPFVQYYPGEYKMILASKEMISVKKLAEELGFDEQQFTGVEIV